MKTEFQMSKADLAIAVREYFSRRGLENIKEVRFNASQIYDPFDRATQSFDVSATVEVDMSLESLLTSSG